MPESVIIAVLFVSDVFSEIAQPTELLADEYIASHQLAEELTEIVPGFVAVNERITEGSVAVKVIGSSVPDQVNLPLESCVNESVATCAFVSVL